MKNNYNVFRGLIPNTTNSIICLVAFTWLVVGRVNAQRINIAPLAVASASTCNTGPCSALNDLVLGTCGTQLIWITTATPPAGTEFLQFEWPSFQPIDGIRIHHAEQNNRYLSGGTIQRWDTATSTWINHFTFAGLNQANCINEVNFPRMWSPRLRITGFQTGPLGQLSNLNFREIEVFRAPASNDAGISGYDAPVAGSVVVGSNPVVARLRNFGNNQISNVTLNWTVNGVAQTTIPYTSLLDTFNGIGAFNVPVTLGNLAVANNVSYRVKSWTSSPNLVPDTNNVNDTFENIFRVPLAGNYTIGSSGDFLTITEAITTLNSAGVSSPVTFSLINSVYSSATGEVFPITANRIIGASATNTITIKPAISNTPLITDSVANALFVFNGTQWFNFDGRWTNSDTDAFVTIENRSASPAATVVRYLNDASDNIFRNNIVRSSNPSTNTAQPVNNAAILIGGTNVGIPTGNDRITIRRNIFARSRNLPYQNAVVSDGQSSFAQNDQIRIDSNSFYGFTGNGIFVTPNVGGNGSNWLIQTNHFFDTAAIASTIARICINFNPSTNSNSNGDTIRGNFIGGNAPYAPQGAGQRWLYSATNTFTGIQTSAGVGTGVAVLNNVFRSFRAINTASTGQIIGFNISNPGVTRVANNTIGDMVDTNSIFTVSNSAFIGMNIFATNDVIVTNNLISNVNVVSNTTASALRGIVTGTGSNHNLLVTNNWLRALHTRSTNVGTTTTAAWNGIVVSSSSPNQTISNNLIGGNDLSDSCSVYYGPVGSELPAGTAAGARMYGITQSAGTNNITTNTIKYLFSQSNGANTTNSSANILGICLIGGNNGQSIQNNTLDSFILRTPAVGHMIAGVVNTSPGASISNNTISDFYATSNNTSTTTSASITGINSSTTNSQFITNNTIFNFDNASNTSNQINGIVISAAAGNVIRGNTIRNLRSNSTSSLALVGINSPNTSLNTSIIGNTIHSLVSYSTGTTTPGLFGILNSGSTTVTGNNALVARNIVHSFGVDNTGTGTATLTGIQATSGNALYANNMVRLGRDTTGSAITRSATIRGLQLSSTGGVQNRFLHNSVYLESSPAAGTANTVCLDLTGNMSGVGFTDVRNNIFVNNTQNAGATANHYIVRQAGTSIAGYVFGSNIYNTPASSNNFVARLNTTDYSNLNAWRAASLQDGTTALIDPNFINPTGDPATVNLGLNVSSPAERGGDTAVAAIVVDDVDGALRDTMNRTDIGAKAYNRIIAIDGNAPRIAFSLLPNTTNTTNAILTASIADGGGLPQDPAKLPRVYFKKTTSGTWLSEPGTLTAGNRFNGTWTFTVNSAAMGGLTSGDSVQYYIIAQDSLGNNVNSNTLFADASSVSAVTTHPAAPNAYRITAPFPSTILVGSGQTFTTLTGTGGAFEALNGAVLTGNTEVLITSNIIEPATVGLNRWQEQGAGNYTVTIRPQTNSQVVLSSNVVDANGLIKLNNTTGVRILGWSPAGTIADTNLIIRASNTATPALGFINGGSDDTIQNVIFEGRISNASSGVVFIAPTNVPATRGVSNVLIQRCHVRQDSTILPTNGIFIVGTAPRMNSNIRIDGNFIYNILGTGGNNINVNATGLGNGNNFTITNNHIYLNAISPLTVNWQGISFTPSTTSDNNIISGNWIGGTAPFAGGTPFISNAQVVPMSVNSGTNTGTAITNNVVTNFVLTGTSGMTGIFASGTNAVFTITGNRIGNWTDSARSITFTASSNNRLQGINAAGTGNVTVSNDTVVNIYNAGTSTTVGITGILVGGGASNTSIISNNVVRNLFLTASTNTTTTTGASLMGILCTSSSTNQSITNNLVQSLVSTSSGNHQIIGIINGAGITTISGNTVFGMQTRSIAAGTNNGAALIGICNNSSATGAHFTTNNIVDSLWYTATTPASTQIIGINHSINTSIHQSMIIGNTVRNLNSRSISVGTGLSSAIIGIVQNNPTLNLQVSQNSVSVLNHLNTTASSIIGIYNNASAAINANNSQVTRNFVHSLRSNAINPARPIFTGIFNNAGFSTYANNMIRLGIDSAGIVDTSARIKRGIFQNNNVQNNYYHNSIYIAGAANSGLTANSAAIELGLSIPNITGFNVKVDIRNNILMNTSTAALPDTSKHFGLRMVDTLNIISNYNLFNVTGTNGFVAGTNFNDFATLASNTSSWKFRTGLDLQSGSGDPAFDANATGTANVVTLAVQPNTPIERSGDGSLASIITNDFFGNTRTGQADIGAHSGAFNLTPDLFPPVINYTPLIATGTLSGVRPFNGVTITDNNGIPVSGTDRPRVYYSKDGVSWFSTPSTTITGAANNATVNFNIDYGLLGALTSTDTIRYYVLAQDNASNTLSNAPFAIATNVNTVINHPVNPNRYNFLPVIAANTIIPVGIGQTYTSLTSAGGLFEFLNSRTLGGSIVAEITSDLTNETGAVVLNQVGEDGPGAGTFTVTIRPNATTTTPRLIAGNVANSLITLNGVNRVKITGVPLGGSPTARLLRFRNNNTTASTILARNGAQGILLNNLIVEGGNTLTTSGVIAFMVTGGSNAPCINDTVNGCFITNNQTSVLPAGVPAFAVFNDGATGVLNTNFVFTNNEVSNYLNSGVVIGNNFGNGFTISNNSFYNNSPTIPSSTFFWSINVVPGANSSGNIVTNNFIGGSAANCGGTPWSNTNLTTQFIGVRISTGTGANTLIQNNTVRNIAFTATGTSLFTGISVLGGNSTITNNSIGSTTTNNSVVFAHTSTHTGIEYTGSNNATITNNTVAGLNVGTAGLSSSFNGITVSNGSVSAISNNTIGGTLANSIVNNGTGITNGINISNIPVNLTPTYTLNNNTVQNISMPGSQSTIVIRGILAGTSAQPIITNNTVANLSTATVNITTTGTGQAISGITVAASGNVIPVIANNTISALRLTNTSTIATNNVNGIVLSSGQGIVVNANRIFDITNASTSTSTQPVPTAVGINHTGGSVNNFITNNQISLGNGQNTNTQFIGIWTNTSNNGFVMNALNNSIIVSGNVASGNQNSYAYLRGNNTVTEQNTFINLRNNILANTRTGGTGNHFALANQAPTPSSATWVPASSQYNLLITANANTVGQWGLNSQSYADWITSSSSDIWSYYMPSSGLNPANLFTNIATGNLGIQTANVESWYVFGKGIAGTAVNNLATDFNGTARGTTFGFGTTIGSIQLNTIPSMLPPAATASAAVAPNTSVTYTFAGRRVATVNWGTNAPTSANLLNFTGITAPNQPSGNNANQYLRVDVSGGTTPYAYGVDLTYDPALLGAVSAAANLKVSKETTGSTASAPVWTTIPIALVNTANNTVSASGLTSSLTNLFFTATENNAPPVINSFNPSARQVGGTVTITGRNFTGTTALTFANGVPQPTFTVVNDTTITTTVPAGAITGTVSATNPNGTGTSTAVMTVIQAPTIVSFNPPTATRGATVTITGTNFTTATQVQFNAVNALFTINSATQITATVPAAATTGIITVTNPAGTAISASAFNVILAPTVTLFSPATGSAGTSVSIDGTNFISITNVAFNGVAASYTVNSPTNITAIVPSTATTGIVSVTNGSGTGNSGTNFTVTTPPTITSFNPSSGGIGTVVVITGTNFTGTTAVTFNGTAASSFTVNSSTQITATVATGSTTGLILVTTPSGVTNSGTNFTVIPDLIVNTTTFITGTYNNVTVTSTGVATLSGPITALGNVLVQTGGRIDFGSNVISGNGNFTNQSGTRLTTAGAVGFTATGGVTGSIQVSGTRSYAANAHYVFNGGTAQNIGDGITAADTITISNSSGVSLGAATTINQRLILTSGSLLLGNFSLTMAPAASINGASITNYIVTNNSPTVGGFLRMTVANNATNVVFPIGTATSYTPATLQQAVAGTTDVFAVRAFNGVNTLSTSGSPITNNTVNRTWLITENVSGGSNLTLALTWNSTDELAGFTNTNCNIAHFTGSTWHTTANATATGAGPFTRTSSVITFTLANTGFALADPTGAVPVSLADFKAIAIEEDVLLNWITASEINNQSFIIERSVDGVQFDKVDEVKGAGNSNTERKYAYTDKDAFAINNTNTLYYRIKDVDFNGNVYESSSIVTVTKGGDNVQTIVTYPNPFTSDLNVSFVSTLSGTAEIKVKDMNGKTYVTKLLDMNQGINKITLTEMSELGAGVYFMQLIANGETKTIKVIKY